jgi:hypothetical protein
MRKELLNDMPEDCSDDCQDWIKGILDDIENRINKAVDLLEKIKSIDDLENVKLCHKELESLSHDLY